MTIDEWLVIIIGFISLIPSFILLKQYIKTSIVDFLLFSGVFFSVTATCFSSIFADATNILFFFQLHRWALVFTFLFFFLHGSRILWTRTPTVIWYIGIIWFAILVFLILFWEIIPQEDTAFVLFMEMPHGPNQFHPKGAGLKTPGGVILNSSSHRLLSDLYSLYTAGILGYTYIKIKPIHPTKKIVITKRLWLIIWSLVFVYGILGLPWVFHFLSSIISSFSTIRFLLILIAEVLSAFIAIMIPESMLISQTQVLRAQKLYKQVQQFHSKQEIKEFGMESLVEYLKHIPKEAMAVEK